MEPNPFLWLLEDPPDFDADMQNFKCCGDLKFLKPKYPPDFVEVNHAKEAYSLQPTAKFSSKLGSKTKLSRFIFKLKMISVHT